MKRKYRIASYCAITLFCGLLAENNSFAQLSVSQLSGREINTITSAVPFLMISPDARGGGMGDAGVASLPDAN